MVITDKSGVLFPSLPYTMETVIFSAWSNLDNLFGGAEENYTNLIIPYTFQRKTLTLTLEYYADLESLSLAT